MMSGVFKYIQLKLGDDNGKNCGAIAVRIPGTQAANLLSRARWCSTINVEKIESTKEN